MKRQTQRLRNQFNNKKNTTRFHNWYTIQRFAIQMNRCGYCFRVLNGNAQIDHVNPVCSGNKSVNNYSNLIICCKTCNRLKGIKRGVEYPRWIVERKNKLSKLNRKDLLLLAKGGQL